MACTRRVDTDRHIERAQWGVSRSAQGVMFDVSRVKAHEDGVNSEAVRVSDVISGRGGLSTHRSLLSLAVARLSRARLSRATLARRSFSVSVARTRGAAQHAHDAARDLFYITNTTHARKETRQRGTQRHADYTRMPYKCAF